MPAQEVVDAFKRFDRDGNGLITLQELQDVLGALDPFTWSPDAVQDLMTQADKTGDGKMGIDEFMVWLFGDKQAQATVEYQAQIYERKGRKVGELFAFFDRDSDRYWNRTEANNWCQATSGKPLSDVEWEQFLRMAKDAPDGNDESKGLKLETMVWFYTKGDMTSMDIESEHACHFMKVQMAEEIFDCFDVDKDGHWSYAESVVCAKATEGEDFEQTEEIFYWLVDKVGDDKAKGLKRNTILQMYCNPAFSEFDLKLDKDHGSMRDYKKKLALEIFKHFDQDGDGYWNYKESCDCNKATSTSEQISEEKFKELALQYSRGEDPDMGFSERLVVHMYTDARFELDVMKDHAIVVSLRTA